MTAILPKEFSLEQPAKYDEIKIRKELSTLIKAYGVEALTDTHMQLLVNVFADNRDHSELFWDIWCFILDDPTMAVIYTENTEENRDKFLKQLIIALFEAGYFC